jgi:hypothetical protein
MDIRTSTSILYLANSALLVTHEIDSAFWHEWDLFHLPGDLQGFLVVNLVLVLIVLYGFKQVLLETRSGRWFSLALAGAGIFAFSVHGYFLLRGHPEFRLPVSIGLLWATFVVSLVQGGLALVAKPRS